MPPKEIDIDQVRLQFLELECDVKFFNPGVLEVTSREYPVKTLVDATAFFVTFSSFIYARPRDFLGRMRHRRDALLNELNQQSRLATFTCDETRFTDGAWSIMVRIRFTAGEVVENYPTESLKHMLMLWQQDVAEAVLRKSGYELLAMIVKDPK
jgi:hypothetical protein